MRQVLVDTSALYALADSKDPDHPAVSGFVRGLRDATLLVTDYILDETLTLMKSRFGPQAAIAMGEKLRESTFCVLIHVESEDEARTWQIFKQYDDKQWSYTDCSSLAIMRKLSITEALALDSHFAQMGVTRWP